MKKINELVTSTEKPEQRAKKKAITFGSFKRAEERQIAERKEREHQQELALIAEQARIERELAEEEQRVIREENKRKRSEFITESMSNAFNTKTDVDFKPVREKVIDKYLPQLREQEVLDDYPKPFEAEPALNRELAEFKKKINEHLHKVGFMGSGGGGAGSFSDLDDVDPTTAKVDGKTIQFDGSTNKFVGADVTAGALAADNLTAGDSAILLTTSSGDITIDAAANDSDIILKGTDGGSDTTFLTIDGSAGGKATFSNEIVSGTTITSGAGLVIANGSNIGSASDTDAIAIASDGVVTFSQAPVFPDGSIAVADIDIDGATDIGAAIVDADLFIVDDGAGGTNRKVAASRLKSYAGFDGSITTLDIDGGTDIGEALADGDLLIVDNGAGGTNRKTEVSRIKTYIADVTLTTAAQTNITSLGTLTTLTVDNIIINGTNIGHTSDTDAISIDSSGNVTASQNLTVTGDFTVNGTTTTVSTTNLKVSDTLIELNTGAGSNANDMGILMERGSTGDNAIFMFDESADEFTVGTTTATNDATGNISITAGTFTAATLKGNLVVADDGDIGSASATDAMQISSGGIVTFKDDILIKDGGTIGNASVADVLTLASTGIVTFKDDIIIKDAGTIGSASDTDAISIASNGIVNFSAGATIASNTIKTAGKETMFVPAAAMYPTTSNGCAALAQVETTAGRPDLKVLDFDPSSDENAQFSVAFPKSWNEGVITFRAFFTVSGTNSGTVSWALSGVSMGDNDTIDAAFGTAVAPTAKAHSGTSNDINITAESGNITISNAAVDEYVFFNIMRDVSADNQSGDARLIGIQIFFTTDAANDA